MRIGTVDIPKGIERERYFRELSYLELSALFDGPKKPTTIRAWEKAAPPKSIGLVAPFVITHRQPPPGAKLWEHDATSGDFRASTPANVAWAELRQAITWIDASHVIFRSPESFSPSAANRDRLKQFFGEIAVNLPERVWVPGGLWQVRDAAKLARELDVTLAFDPLVLEPGAPPEIHYDLDVPGLYLRIERPAKIRNEQLEDLAALIESYDDLPITIAFASPERWPDARNLKKLLEA